MNEQPIGIFDSGVGGLSVWQTTAQLLPQEQIIYLADTKNCPYGPKPVEKIIDLCKKNVDFLLSRNCKLIMVACNTATSAAIEVLRETYDVPFVGMEPAVKPAALSSKTGKIGVLATEGTLNGNLFKNTTEKYASHLEVFVQIGHGLVELVEQNRTTSPEAYQTLENYLNPMILQQVDQVVLGCTHYPFLIPAMQQILGSQITIVNPAGAVSKQAKKLLETNGLLFSLASSLPNYAFFANGDPTVLKNLVDQIFSEMQISNNFIITSVNI